MSAGMSGQDKDGLPRGATGDAECWSPLAPREFWETSVLSFMVKEVCGYQAEEVDGQSGMDTNRKFGENRVGGKGDYSFQVGRKGEYFSLVDV